MSFQDKQTPFVVYGKFNFVAEEPDEICFNYGEPVVVLEKDEQFNDGWWRGQNLHGQIGLFPMNFITEENIANVSDATLSRVVKTLKKVHLQSQDASIMDLSPSLSEASPPSVEKPTVDVSFSSSNSGTTFGYRDSYVLAPAESDFDQRHPDTWNIQEVALWIQQKGFSHVSERFIDHEITGDILLELTLGTLKELGIDTLNDRINILHHIIGLRETWSSPLPTPLEPKVDQESALILPTLVEPKIEQESALTSPTLVEPKIEQQDSGLTLSTPLEPKVEQRLILPEESRDDKVLSTFTVSDYIREDNEFKVMPPTPQIPDLALSPSGTTQALGIEESPKKSRVWNQLLNLGKKSDFKGQQEISPQEPRSPELLYPTTPECTESQPRRRSIISQIGKHISFLGRRGSSDAPPLKLDMSNPDYEGWLYVRISDNRTWKRRYCVLKNQLLHLFKNSQQQRLIAIIPFNVECEILPDETEGAKTPYTFVAHHQRSRAIHFCAETQLSMVTWLNVLVRAIKDAKLRPIPLIPIKNEKRASVLLPSPSLPMTSPTLSLASGGTSPILINAPTGIDLGSKQKPKKTFLTSALTLKPPLNFNTAGRMPPAKFVPTSLRRTSIDVVQSSFQASFIDPTMISVDSKETETEVNLVRPSKEGVIKRSHTISSGVRLK